MEAPAHTPPAQWGKEKRENIKEATSKQVSIFQQLCLLDNIFPLTFNFFYKGLFNRYLVG